MNVPVNVPGPMTGVGKGMGVGTSVWISVALGAGGLVGSGIGVGRPEGVTGIPAESHPETATAKRIAAQTVSRRKRATTIGHS
ncbi:MAG: hypothetical protein WCD37_09530 [Chloroflexia bacterium]